MAPPIIMTPFQFLGSILGVPASVASYLNTITSSLQLWFQQFQQWSRNTVQILDSFSGSIVHTGDVTNDTVRTVTVSPAVFSSSSNIRIKFAVQPTVQGGVATQISIQFNGTVIFSFSLTNTGNTICEANMSFVGGNQVNSGIAINGLSTPPASTFLNSTAIAIGTAPTFKFLIQNGTNTDSQKFLWDTIEVF